MAGWLVLGMLVALVVLRRVKGPRRPPPTYSVEYDREGFTVRSTKPTEERILWAAVYRILAFKQDLWSSDRICFAFSDRLGALQTVVHEDMEGWVAFITALPHHLAGCLPFEAWYQSVAFPTFKPN